MTPEVIQNLIERCEKATGPDRELDDALLDLACEVYVTRRGWKLAHIGPDYDGKNESDFYTRDGKLVDGFDYPRKGGVGKFYHVRGEVLPWGVIGFRQDMRSAIAFAEAMFPGAFWFMSKGRVRAKEPLYGFQLMFGDKVLGEAESDRDFDAIILATLRALQSQACTQMSDELVERLRRGARYLPRTALEGSKEALEFRDAGDAILVNEGDFWLLLLDATNAAARIKSDADTIASLRRENAELRRIISECAAATGAGIAPLASVEFMAKLPDEIRIGHSRAEAKVAKLTAEIEAEREACAQVVEKAKIVAWPSWMTDRGDREAMNKVLQVITAQAAAGIRARAALQKDKT